MANLEAEVNATATISLSDHRILTKTPCPLSLLGFSLIGAARWMGGRQPAPLPGLTTQPGQRPQRTRN